jgi:tripeptidyl-peptidase-1
VFYSSLPINRFTSILFCRTVVSLLDWVNQVMDMDNPPWVHSVSYGNDEVQQTSVEYMDTCNVQFQAAGAMGLSILFASGDQGVWGRSGVGATYNPDFPAASPWITAVGGTNFQTKSVIGPESTWDCGGGGFSDTFARPAWQTDVVNSYIAAATAAGVLPSQSLWNATGRAYPDVAALGGQTNPYCVAIKGGSFGGVAGTSASCPVVAGIIAQLNDVRFRAGQSSLGWLNQFIYQNGQCFNDVNDGSMNNCNKGTTGFAALDGWDPATGFGSPNFACLKALMPNV